MDVFNNNYFKVIHIMIKLNKLNKLNKPMSAFVSYTIFVTFASGYFATYLVKGKI